MSRLQFDSATEQLNTMFHELLNKVMGQEQDWHKVIDRLSTEMECKVGMWPNVLLQFIIVMFSMADSKVVISDEPLNV